DVDFAAVFGLVTFNFLDDQFSVDIGGRFQDVDKFATAVAHARSWVFDVCPEDPCDPLVVPTNMIYDPNIGGYVGDEGDVDGDPYYLVDSSTVTLYAPVAPGTPLYAMPHANTRDVPVPWLSGNAYPVGVTAADFNVRAADGEGPYAENFTDSSFSPQITLRYRLDENLSLYTRYAESTKIGGFDTGQTSLPGDIEELSFETEDAEQIELGVKGTMFGGRFRFDADIFELEFPNLQTTAVSPDPNQTSASVNAGQRVRGVEFNTQFAATENIRLGLSGAFLDGKMTDFKNSGCTNAEIAEAVGNPDAPCEFFDDDGIQFFPTTIDEAIDSTAFVDRTGETAPRTPDWKVVFSADYYTPISDVYEFTFNLKAYASDGYILNVEAFDLVTKYNRHEDMNVILGIRNLESNWAVSLFARNILEARPSYNAQFDTIPNGLESVHLSPSSFTTYGLKFEYFME
ncbi:MAG: TonB-dependent receptor domain-containing protein, partial [Woeseiaceae bacterium]